ncbi:MAG: DNA alkylation repair protein [Bacteroidales bacterium]|nr:DNA alkylation repair protein [Candidatus Liminaster caballi]
MNILLSKIHARFRQLRSGEVSDNLRAQGVVYRVAWGVESYKLKTIADEFRSLVEDEGSLAELADKLWAEDVRESKMLATRLHPVSLMTLEKAESWASDVRYTEQADQLCMNLLSHLAFARNLVKAWIDGDTLHQYMALHIASRLEIDDSSLRLKACSIVNNTQQPLWLRSMANNIV